MEFKGFRVKPDDRGMSLFTSDNDSLFNGSTETFNFVVVASDKDEANLIAKHALGEINFTWD